MFQLRLFYDKRNKEGNVVDEIDIRCSNCNKETWLYLKHTPIENIITKFVLNAILHHVGMSWKYASRTKCSMQLKKMIILIG